MRWWPWGDRSEREAPAPAPPVEPTSPPPAEAWRTLPPTPPTVSEHEPVFKTLDFGDDLRSWHSPTFVRELRHELSPTGPIGVMSGITTTVPTASVARTLAPDAADQPVRDAHASRPRRLPAVQRSAFAGTVALPGPAALDLVRSPAPIHDPFVVPSLQRSAPDLVASAGAPEPAPPIDDVPLLGDRAGAPVLEPPSDPVPAALPPSVSTPPPPSEVSARSGLTPRSPVRLGLGPPLPAESSGRPASEPANESPAPPVDSAPAPGSPGAPPVGEVTPSEPHDVPLLGGTPPPTVLGPAGPIPTAPPAETRGGDASPTTSAAPGRPSQRQVQRTGETGSAPLSPTEAPGVTSRSVGPTMGPPLVGPDPGSPSGPLPGPPPIAARDVLRAGEPDSDAIPRGHRAEPEEPSTVPDPGAIETVPVVPLLGDRPLERGIDQPLAADPPTGPAAGVDPVGGRLPAPVQRSVDPPTVDRSPPPVPAGPGGGAAPPSLGERVDVPMPVWRPSVAVLARRPIDPVLTGSGATARADAPVRSSSASVGDPPGPAVGSALGAVQRRVIAEPAEPEARAVFDPIPLAPGAAEPLALTVPRPSAGPSAVRGDGGVRPAAGPAASPSGVGLTARSALVAVGGSGPVPGAGVQRSAVAEVRAQQVVPPRWPVQETSVPASPTVTWEGHDLQATVAVGAIGPAPGTGGRPVQREGEGAEAPPPVEAASAPPAATVSVGAPAPAGADPGLIGSDDQIDQLAKRLYPRIRDRIRIEARLDRERAGRALDVQR